MKARDGGVGFWHANHSVHQTGGSKAPSARGCLKWHTSTGALAEDTQLGAQGAKPSATCAWDAPGTPCARSRVGMGARCVRRWASVALVGAVLAHQPTLLWATTMSRPCQMSSQGCGAPSSHLLTCCCVEAAAEPAPPAAERLAAEPDRDGCAALTGAMFRDVRHGPGLDAASPFARPGARSPQRSAASPVLRI